MALVNDDPMNGYEFDGVDESDLDGVENAVNEYFSMPDSQKEVALMAAELELLGYGDDPELLGAWLKNLVSRIKTGIQKIKARRAGGSVALTLPSASYTPPAESSESSPAGGLLKNPMVLVGGGAAVLLLLMAMKKK